MTCIVGYIDKENIYIGGDSLGSSISYKTERQDEKVFIRGDMIFGYTSSFRMGQLLRYSLNIPAHDPSMDNYEYMCTDFINSVAECFKTANFATLKDNVSEGGNFLVGYKGKIYEIEDDFQVGISKDPYYSVGSGMYFAIGSLFTSRDLNIPVEKKIKTAILAAAKYNPFVGGQILIKKLPIIKDHKTAPKKYKRKIKPLEIINYEQTE